MQNEHLGGYKKMELPETLSKEFQEKLIEHGFSKQQASSKTVRMALELFADMDSKEILAEMAREAEELKKEALVTQELLRRTLQKMREQDANCLRLEKKYDELSNLLATLKGDLKDFLENPNNKLLTDERAKNAFALYTSIKTIEGNEQNAIRVACAYLTGQNPKKTDVDFNALTESKQPPRKRI